MGDDFFMDFSFFAHRFFVKNLWKFILQMGNPLGVYETNYKVKKVQNLSLGKIWPPSDLFFLEWSYCTAWLQLVCFILCEICWAGTILHLFWHILLSCLVVLWNIHSLEYFRWFIEIIYYQNILGVRWTLHCVKVKSRDYMARNVR